MSQHVSKIVFDIFYGSRWLFLSNFSSRKDILETKPDQRKFLPFCILMCSSFLEKNFLLFSVSGFLFLGRIKLQKMNDVINILSVLSSCFFLAFSRPKKPKLNINTTTPNRFPSPRRL